MNLIQLVYRLLTRGTHVIMTRIYKVLGVLYFYANNVKFGRGLVSNGLPKVRISPGGHFRVGENLKMNNSVNYNLIGRQQPCSFVILKDAMLDIGNNVGMSSTAFFCSLQITIGDFVKFGGNCCVYDTDFHSLSYLDRQLRGPDLANTKSANVLIGNNVFVGAHTTILKGVTIGDNSIIGACSVVTKSIPTNQIWAGNPAKYIKDTET